MSKPLLRLFVLACPVLLAAALPVAARAQVSTTLSSTGTGIEFGNISSDARKTVGAAGLSRVVDVDVRLDASPACDGAAGSSEAAIAHSRVGDITITLLSPQNTSITLMAQRGGARDNVCSLVFDDDGGFPSIATLTSVNGQPASGSFAPEDPLSIFDGEDPNGGWSLRVDDTVTGTSGIFNRFTLVLKTEAVQDIVVDVFDDPAPNGCTAGSCSLREAVLFANTRPGLDRIVLPAGELQLIRAGTEEDAGDTGDLDVTDSLEIVGAGRDATTVLQLASDRLLHSLSGSEVTLRAVTLAGGKGVEHGGAVLAGRRLVTRSARFRDNRASVRGGAIFHGAGGQRDWPPRLELVDTLFVDNLATGNIAPASYGGAIYGNSSGFQTDHGVIDGCSFTGNEADSGGGAIALGAVQSVSGTGYVIRNSIFEGNRADRGHGGAIGTNLDESGIVDLTVLDSLFTGNIAAGIDPDEHGGGALRMRSGRLMRLANTTFEENDAGTGGAILLVDASGLIQDSTFSRNQAQIAGGAILAYGALTLERSTLEGNLVTSTSVTDVGGGGLAAYSSTAITRSTFSGNSALRGGAISSTAGDLALTSNTLVTGSANLPPFADGTILHYTNANAGNSLSLFANIIIGRCLYSSGAIVPDAAAYNIEASGNTCRYNLAPLPVGNKVAQAGAAVNLATLADNGGPTPTHLPVAPSIAIDAASNLGCPPIDQRDYVRADAMCDIGAVEAGGVPASTSLFTDGFEP